MDQCELMAQELDDLNSWYTTEIRWCGLKAVLAILGLDWVVDVIRGEKSFGDVFGLLEAFILALLALDFAAIIIWLTDKLPKLLEHLPLGDALKQQIKKLLGPVALFFLVIDLGFAVKLFIDCREIALSALGTRASSIYNSYDCANKDQIFRDKGIDIPR